MKTTIYELLGMIKDGKAPKKIKYDYQIWNYRERTDLEGNILFREYINEETERDLFDEYLIPDILNDEVEILETTVTINQDSIDNNKQKLKATLNCIKDSETILGGEYYVIHSDFIIVLEEEIDKINEIIDKLE